MATTQRTTGWFIELLHDSTGKFINIETTDGLIREGRVSGLRLRSLMVNNVSVDFIEEIELNGDPTDCIPINRIGRIIIQTVPTKS